MSDTTRRSPFSTEQPDLVGDASRTVDALLAAVAYKPDWTFVTNLGCLQVEVETTDSADPDRQVAITHRFVIPLYLPDVSRSSALLWLFDQIMAVERHEAAEVFRHEGVAPFHPHRQTQP